jgi:PAS domain S-box-containing protein
MTKRYLVALGLVALLSITAYLSLRQTISTQEAAAAIVNYSGKRRYSSQRAALFASQLAAAASARERTRARSEMLASIAIMENAHRGLLDGNPALNLPGNPSPAISARYFAGPRPVDPLIREYIARVRSLATAPDLALGQGNPDLLWILATAPGELLDALDGLVGEYQRESEGEIERLQHLETAVLSATLLVLCLEALFIFRPMVSRVLEERRKLERAEAYNRSILDHSHDGIVTIDHHGDVASANPAVEKMFGLPRGGIVGLPFTQLVHAAGRSDDGQAWATPTTGVHTIATSRRDGSGLAVDVSFSAMTMGADRLVIAIMRESTEQLQRHARDLERRNQELDQFAYIASHDLKAPLRAIVNLATWIEEDLKGMIGAIGRQHLDLLRGRVRRLEALIDGIHQYATATRPTARLEAIDTAALVREIADEHDHERRFAFVIAPGLPRLTTDRTRLWQVFSNLIANAIKHHHLGSGTVEVGARDAGASWEFSVRDDGPGIAPQHHEKIFVIFQTLVAKDVKESLGLGLALVKKIVREQGGNVSLDSAAGGGATFRFTWPKQAKAGEQRLSA